MNNQIPFKRFGTMIDCSRNAVMTVSALKKWIDITSELGYNTLMLYTEDTYELNDNPYFGYMRGRYTKAELKELSCYANEKGIELMPCIQTLAHLKTIMRWRAYSDIVDIDDILLADDERVYELIESMFKTLSECFTSRTVNVGMDEAHNVGKGKYFDIHGQVDRTEILIKHIKRVAEIGKKYGFSLCMWSDMFYRLCVGDYSADNFEISESARAQIPDNVELIYWDYYGNEKERYDKMLSSHEAIKSGTWFAGGLWTWEGFVPYNEISINRTKLAFESCVEHNIENVFLTLWGDNGGECSVFAVLPSLFYASEYAKGNRDEASIKSKFKKKFNMEFDDFMLLDLKQSNKTGEDVCNSSKYLLYNDPFIGIMDSLVFGNENEIYANCAQKLEKAKVNDEWKYLFDSELALCKVLSNKAQLGQMTRDAYSSKDFAKLESVLKKYYDVENDLKTFYEAYKTEWFTDKKAFGFEVIDARLGGLIYRINHCAKRLEKYISGEIDKIDELEEAQLDFEGNGADFKPRYMINNEWSKMISANNI